jgi:hypothetical protein
MDISGDLGEGIWLELKDMVSKQQELISTLEQTR